MTCKYRRTFCFSAILLLSAVTGGFCSAAEARDQLNVIVPIAPGGALDRFARTAKHFLPNVIDADIEVENFSPKKGEDGYKAFIDRPADGKTILAWFEPSAAAYGPDMSLDDLAIINVQEMEAPILAARSSLGWRNLRQMIEAMRQKPGAYRLGIGGRTGGGTLLTNALINNLDLKISRKAFASGGLSLIHI